MNKIVDIIINWSEAWGLILPLIIITRYHPHNRKMKPVIIYVFLALTLNIIALTMAELRPALPSFLQNNNLLYNLHSLVRVICFSWFILLNRIYLYPYLLKGLLITYSIFLIINYTLLEPLHFISTNAFSAESVVLLVFTLSFFLKAMLDDSRMNWLKHPVFLVCAGLAFYEAITFFSYLLFYAMLNANEELGDISITVNNIVFVIFATLLGIALYRSVRPATTKVVTPHPSISK